MLILVLRSAEVEPVDTSSAVRVVNGKPSVSIESLLGGSDSHTSRSPCYAVPASSSTSMKQDSSVQEPKKSIRGSGSGYGRARGKCPPPKKKSTEPILLAIKILKDALLEQPPYSLS